MPTVFTKEGFRFHFYSNERNEPPRIHANNITLLMERWNEFSRKKN